MNFIISICISFLSFHYLDTKPIEISPEIMDYPNISNKAILDYNKKVKEYKKLEVRWEKSGKASLTSQEVEFYLMNEFIEEEADPFNTDSFGCSWYCAGGPYKILSSSNLAKSKVSNYEPGNIHDFDLKTTWATESGINQTIKFYFKGSETLSITTIDWFNGYIKNETAWKNNSRVKKALLSINGRQEFILKLEDTYKMQRFDIGEVFCKGENNDLIFEFKILEIYKGDKYEDLCISEINFDGEGDH